MASGLLQSAFLAIITSFLLLLINTPLVMALTIAIIIFIIGYAFNRKEKCARCGKPLSFKEKNFYDTISINIKHPDNPYEKRKLCSNCYEFIYNQPTKIPKKENQQKKPREITWLATNDIETNCPKCGKTFPSEQKMLQHYEAVHENLPRFITADQRLQQSESQGEQNFEIRRSMYTDFLNQRTTNLRATITKTPISYLSLFAVMLLSSILFANPIFLYVGLIPLFFVALGLVFNQPKLTQFKRREIKTTCIVGEDIEVTTDVTINGGLGLLIARDVIPEHFELVEGNNLKIIWKGFKDKKDTISFKVRCTKRGIYAFDRIEWEFRHALGLRQTLCGQFTQKQAFTVQLRSLPLRKIRNTKALSKLPLPLGAQSRLGIVTTDFKEIREYSTGDPYKNINWKVTARLSSGFLNKPFINEFEKEGKKFVWIFIDGSYSMGSHGTTISNAFENAIIAANDLSQYYLERDCFVGVYAYNKRHTMVYPDIGRRQRFKISRELLRMEMGRPEPLREAIQRCRRFLIGNSPLSIIITALTEDKTSDLIEDIKELAKYSRRRTTLSVLVINVESYYFAAKTEEEKISAKILQAKGYPLKSRLRQAGATVVDWNPTAQPLSHMLLREVKRR
ncbi:MAG: DUF58 domain-containing protein [Candidatus Bathyarchaeota archaeon]|nr:DUF58 domain-containing protein [Candidatus Bathyarchaeota archaeon]